MQYFYFVRPKCISTLFAQFLAQFNMETGKFFHPITRNRCMYVCPIVFGPFSGFPANAEGDET